jgi:Nif-specific regulatory protein
MHARLTLERGLGSPAVYELASAGTVSLGRNLNNTVVLQDEHASRWHAEIVHERGRWLIRDLDTRNGTRVNRERIQGAVVLHHGHEIAIGNSRLRFTQDEVDLLAVPRDLGAGAPTNGAPTAAGTAELESTQLEPDDLTALCSFMSASVEAGEADCLIRRALDTVQRQTDASVAGFLNLDTDNPLPRMVVPEIAHVDIHLSRYLTQRVQREDRPVWLKAESGPPAGEGESLLLFSDALCVPLRAEGAPLAALHVYKTGQYFTERHLQFCEVLAGHLASSLRLLRLRRNLEAENTRLRGRSFDGEQIIGNSRALQELRQLILRAASRPATVLIAGESGVGKELVALALHRHSDRRDGPLVVLNCAAIAPTLIEAELFGYRKGAFTGADRDHPGLFQQADEGTLFLDEVGELPLDCQAKLLRVIEGKGFRPVGGIAEVRADVRIVAATNRDLEREVRDGKFREDLYFRLRVIPIQVAPLRDRPDDIPILAEYFLAKLSQDLHHPVRLSADATRHLQEYSWPGNVRQLRSVLECSLALSDKEVLDAEDLRLPRSAPANQPPTLNLEELEAWAIEQALRRTGGNVTQAAKLLGVVRDTLTNRMKQKGIRREGHTA